MGKGNMTITSRSKDFDINFIKDLLKIDFVEYVDVAKSEFKHTITFSQEGTVKQDNDCSYFTIHVVCNKLSEVPTIRNLTEQGFGNKEAYDIKVTSEGYPELTYKRNMITQYHSIDPEFASTKEYKEPPYDIDRYTVSIQRYTKNGKVTDIKFLKTA